MNKVAVTVLVVAISLHWCKIRSTKTAVKLMIAFEKNHKCLGLVWLLQQRDQGLDWGYVAQRARAETSSACWLLQLKWFAEIVLTPLQELPEMQTVKRFGKSSVAELPCFIWSLGKSLYEVLLSEEVCFEK